MTIYSFDKRRKIVVPGNSKETLQYSVDHFIEVAQEAIDQRGQFYVALAGGSTPKAIYQELALPKNAKRVDWTKVTLFWSDERCVPPDNNDSNFKMAMDSGFSKLPVPLNQIHRMKGELAPEASADEYDHTIQRIVPGGIFDLTMLGMGEDGHTASLFPETEALNVIGRETVANYIYNKGVWRLTLTFDCINRSRHITINVMGAGKAEMVKKVFTDPFEPFHLPVQQVGTEYHPALWILDNEANSELSQVINLK